MSWKFGGLFIKKYKTDNNDHLLDAIHLSKRSRGTEIGFSQAIELKNGETTVTKINDGYLIINNWLPYDCSFEPGETTSFENRLKEFSTVSPLLIFFMDGNSGTYGFIYFSNGKCLRKWAMDSEGILCNEGEVLDAEIPFVTGQVESDGEGRVLAILQQEGITLSKLNQEDIRFRIFF